MKLAGVSGVYDYTGPDRNSRYRSRPCCLPPMQKRQRPDCIFSELNTQPTCTPVYASLNTSRWATQNSGPSGSLLLSRRTLSFPASCRFIPAHCIGDFATTEAASVPISRHLYRQLRFSRTTRDYFRVGDDTSRVSFDKRIGRGTKRGCRAAESCFLAQAQLQAIACNLQLLDSGGAMLDRPISAARCHARI